MEYAMMDELVSKALKSGIKTIRGYYYPTAKNKMVKEFYGLMGFTQVSVDDEGNSIWEFAVEASYENKNKYINCITG